MTSTFAYLVAEGFSPSEACLILLDACGSLMPSPLELADWPDPVGAVYRQRYLEEMTR